MFSLNSANSVSAEMSCVCVLRPVSVFCVLRMLGANTMLGTMKMLGATWNLLIFFL